jgi:hypothetical protein
MTHDELLEAIDFLPLDGLHAWMQPALRAVVELHKPIKNIWITHPDLLACDECSEWTNEGPGAVEYPCPTYTDIYNRIREVM